MHRQVTCAHFFVVCFFIAIFAGSRFAISFVGFSPNRSWGAKETGRKNPEDEVARFVNEIQKFSYHGNMT